MLTLNWILYEYHLEAMSQYTWAFAGLHYEVTVAMLVEPHSHCEFRALNRTTNIKQQLSSHWSCVMYIIVHRLFREF